MIGFRYQNLALLGLALLPPSTHAQEDISYVDIGGTCELGPDASEALSCEPGKGVFCQLETGQCGEKARLMEGTCAATGAMCMMLEQPVCGCDLVQYSNECLAHAAGVNVDYDGPCRKEGGGTPAAAPVEPVLISFEEECEADADCESKDAFCRVRTGTCGGPGACATKGLMCTFDVRPVCGCDGTTYSNACVAHSGGVNVDYDGECETETGGGGGGGGGGVSVLPVVLGALGDECEYDPDASFSRGGPFCQLKTGACETSQAPGGIWATAPEFCTEQYDPVCGCDGTTYSNECKAWEKGVSVAYDDECKKESAIAGLGGKCTFDPDVKADGGAFCLLNAGACVESDSPPGGFLTALPEFCSKEYKPVCGCDGNTYNNECLAHVEGVNVASEFGGCKARPNGGDDGGDEDPPPKVIAVGDGCDPSGEIAVCGEGAFCKLDVGQCFAFKGTCVEQKPFCTADYNPVCGCDGRTYGNECGADGQGISVAYEGACTNGVTGGTDGGDEDPPPKVVAFGESCDPSGEKAVCGEGAFCKVETGQCSMSKGTCVEQKPVCTMDYRPVCGCDAVTYGNECGADGQGVSVAYEGECTKGAPVGVTGGTDGNGGDEDPPLKVIALGDGCDTSGEIAVCGEGAFCKVEAGQCSMSKGTCVEQKPFCTYEYDPVCGCDGVTYGNECGADAEGVSVSYEGECEKSDISLTIDPVALGDTCDDGIAPCDKGLFCQKEEGQCEAFGTCAATGLACTFEYAPVCGCDGVTYGNECGAHSEGVSVSHTGECEAKIEGVPDVAIDAVPETVPDTSGTDAGPAGPVAASGDACEVGTCGDEGLFCLLPEGSCDAGAAGTCAATGQPCDDEYDPVCGCDGTTYSNECYAHSGGMSVSRAGECEEAGGTPDDAEEAPAAEGAGSTTTAATQPAGTDGSSATQSTEPAGSVAVASDTATMPTEMAPFDPNPSSGAVSSKQFFSLCTGAVLAFALAFAE